LSAQQNAQTEEGRGGKEFVWYFFWVEEINWPILNFSFYAKSLSLATACGLK
jgi:hypothetical protein